MKLTDDDRIKYMHGHITTEEDVHIEGHLELSRLFTHGDLHVEGILECDSIRAARITGTGVVYAYHIELAGNIDFDGDLCVDGRVYASEVECVRIDRAIIECGNLRANTIDGVDIFSTGVVEIEEDVDENKGRIEGSYVKAHRIVADLSIGSTLVAEDKDIGEEFPSEFDGSELKSDFGGP